MTAKRFDFEDEYITLDEGVFATAKNKNDAELISRTLNQLYDENEQLKQQMQTILKLTKKIEDCTHDIKMIGDVE